ncbi:MAG: C-terminal binding protein [Planctomycetes bacterium]|nr:C-terminal binding protein [Planctomycetota bacterium]
MSQVPHGLENARVVRLNAELFPVTDYAHKMCRQAGLNPTEVEANTPGELITALADCDAVLVVSSALPTEVVESLCRCRVISRLGTGTDKIDVESATRNGIVVTNVPDFCVEEQADHTMTLLLALERRLPQMSKRMAAGEWRAGRIDSESNRRLSECVLGLVGFGNSARETAKRARAFGMQVLATRRNMAAPTQAAEALGVKMVELDTVLKESDHVSLHLPLTSETRHLLDATALAKMKPDAFLINTSRGAIVDETALAEALRNRRIAGAGLDTFAQIDLHSSPQSTPDHPLLELDNVILTPHVAAYSIHAMQHVSREGTQNLVDVLEGRWPPIDHIVNPSVVPRAPLSDH